MSARRSPLSVAILASAVLLLSAGLAEGQAPGGVTIAAGDVHAAAGIKCEGCHSTPGPAQFAAVPPDAVAPLCGQCHVREAEFYDKSPKHAIFGAMQLPACVTCHTSHAVMRPADNWIGFTPPAVCMACHSEDGPGAPTIRGLQEGLLQIAGAVDRADALLGRAEVAGMLVDEGRTALQGAKEQQILARVAIHAFQTEPLTETAAKGVAAAAVAERIGREALGELRVRRQGLAVATLLIIGFLITLGITIRRLPPF